MTDKPEVLGDFRKFDFVVQYRLDCEQVPVLVVLANEILITWIPGLSQLYSVDP